MATASDPSEGRIALDEPMVGWNGKHFAADATVASRLCSVPDSAACDEFALDVDINPSH